MLKQAHLHTSTNALTGNALPECASDREQPQSSIAHLIFTVDGVAAHFKISRVKVYELINDGTLKSFMIGRRRRISGKEIEATVAKLSGDAQ